MVKRSCTCDVLLALPPASARWVRTFLVSHCYVVKKALWRKVLFSGMADLIMKQITASAVPPVVGEEAAAHVEAQKFTELVRRRKKEERLVVEAAKREAAARSEWRWRWCGELGS